MGNAVKQSHGIIYADYIVLKQGLNLWDLNSGYFLLVNLLFFILK